jgi:superfamily II DNA/RNA helicase
VTALRRGVDILVACPGRLEDLIAQGRCDLSDVSITVLDEADHMADLGFLPAVKRLLDQTPADSQRLLFSATLDKEVDVLVRRYLRDPVTCAVDPVASAVPEAEHHVFTVQAVDKPTVVRELAGGEGRSLLFTRTKHGASRLAKHRNLAAFSGGSARVLVATDIAARGIHVDDIALVVHVDPPAEHKAYTHRSGRTARAGAAGIVVTLATPNQAAEVRKLTKLAGIRAQGVTVKPGDERISQLRGPTAPLVHRAARPAVERPAFDRDRRQPRRGSGQSARSGQPSRSSQPSGSGQPAKRSSSAAANRHQPAGSSSGWKPRRARPAGPRHSGASRSGAGR